MAVARRQVEQLTLVRRRAQPNAVYIARLTATAVFAYLLALQLPGASSRDVLAPLTALLVVQATLYHTIRSAIQRVVGVTAGGDGGGCGRRVCARSAGGSSGCSSRARWALGMLLRLREDILEVPISAMLIFSVDSHAAATSRITETLVGAAAGLAAGLVLAPLRVQPAKDAVRRAEPQMADLLGQMAAGLNDAPDPKRAAEWLERTRALRGEIERVDDALAQAEESIRSNPRRLRLSDPAAGLREGVNTLERAATDMRVLARSVADGARIDSKDSPVQEAETRARLAAVLIELSAAVRAFGQAIEAEAYPTLISEANPEPIEAELNGHLAEAHRQQDRLADVLRTYPAERPEGRPLRGEILAHVDRLRSELETKPLPPQDRAGRPLRMLRARQRTVPTAPRGREDRSALGTRDGRSVPRVRAGQTASRMRAGQTALRTGAGQTALRMRAGQNALRVHARRTASRVRRSV